jgi:hypothetical protein
MENLKVVEHCLNKSRNVTTIIVYLLVNHLSIITKV